MIRVSRPDRRTVLVLRQRGRAGGTYEADRVHHRLHPP